MAIIVQGISNFCNTFEVVETQIFEKKTIFPAKTFIWANFSRIIEYEKFQVTVYRGPQGFFTVILQVIRSFRYDLRCRWKQFLKKKLFFADENKFWLNLPRIKGYGRFQVTFC